MLICRLSIEISVRHTTKSNPFCLDGCAVVPVGHHLSTEVELEWRVSFNAAERKLITSLTPRQRSCYSLTKFLLKTGLSASSILTSYHVKNMMFWFCEQMYGAEEWTEDLQGDRILDFIDYIANALAHRSIPHYFHPPNNLISHRSAAEIEKTRKEVALIREKIFQTLVMTLCKLKCLEGAKGFSSRGEAENMLLIYTVFVQTLYKLGFLNVQHPIAERCFQNIVSLNRSVRGYIKAASPAYSALSVPELLKPFAIAYMQAGETNQALVLYDIMVKSDRTLVETKYPEVYTNLACLCNMKYSSSTDSKDKDSYLSRTEENFQTALKLIRDSPSLHFAYGNYLLHTKENPMKAIEEFKRALDIDEPRQDDEVLVEVDLHGTVQKLYVSGHFAAGLVLSALFVRKSDIYEARRLAHQLEKLVERSTIKLKKAHLTVCARVYRQCGLQGKAELIMSEAFKYSKIK